MHSSFVSVCFGSFQSKSLFYLKMQQCFFFFSCVFIPAIHREEKTVKGGQARYQMKLQGGK